MARLTSRLVPVIAIATSAIALSSCGTSGAVAQARLACRYVDRAIVLYHESRSPGLSTQSTNRLAGQALATLLRATPYAASATSTDGGWNPLMTTINEGERVPIHFLIPSLTHLCQIAQSSTPYL